MSTVEWRKHIPTVLNVEPDGGRVRLDIKNPNTPNGDLGDTQIWVTPEGARTLKMLFGQSADIVEGKQ